MNKTWIPIVFTLCLALCTPHFKLISQLHSASASATMDISDMSNGSNWISDQLVYNYSDPYETDSSPRDINEMRATIVASPTQEEHKSGYLYAAYEYYLEDEQAWGIRVEGSIDGGVIWELVGQIYEPGMRLANPSLAVNPYDEWLSVVYEVQWGSESERAICVTEFWHTEGLIRHSHWETHQASGDVCIGYRNVRNPKIASEYRPLKGNDLFIVYEKVNDANDVDLIFVRIEVGSKNVPLPWRVDDIHRRTLHGTFDWCVTSQPSITYSHGITIAYRRALDHDSVGTIFVARSLDKGDSWTYIPNVDGLTGDCKNPSVVCTRLSGRIAMLMVAFEYMGSIRYS